MLTEDWPLEQDPVWPPRWGSHDIASRPLIVHLDQWCYDHLARDRAGHPVEPSEAGTFEFLRRVALDGSVVFPLSQANYRENWKRTNVDARWDTAVVMGELSGFNTMRLSGLDQWEALVGATKVLDVPAEVETPSVLGWGLKHCLTGVHGEALIRDIRTGEQAQWNTSLSPGTRASLEAVEAAVPYRFELAMLALRARRGGSAGCRSGH